MELRVIHKTENVRVHLVSSGNSVRKRVITENMVEIVLIRAIVVKIEVKAVIMSPENASANQISKELNVKANVR